MGFINQISERIGTEVSVRCYFAHLLLPFKVYDGDVRADNKNAIHADPISRFVYYLKDRVAFLGHNFKSFRIKVPVPKQRQAQFHVLTHSNLLLPSFSEGHSDIHIKAVADNVQVRREQIFEIKSVGKGLINEIRRSVSGRIIRGLLNRRSEPIRQVFKRQSRGGNLYLDPF